jgi:hypothetical protein
MNATDMTATEFLTDFLPRWRAGLPPQHTALVEGFLRRQRGVLEVLAQRALARARATRGELPDTVIEFAAYDPVVAHERRRDKQPDEVVVQQLQESISQRVARGHDPEAMLGDNYVSARTEAILLRHAGWDAVPLMLAKPALAVALGGVVMAVRDTMGRLATHPLRPGEFNHLRADISKAEIRTLYLRDAVDIPPDAKDRLVDFATALWMSAREPQPAHVATPRRPS